MSMEDTAGQSAVCLQSRSRQDPVPGRDRGTYSITSVPWGGNRVCDQCTSANEKFYFKQKLNHHKQRLFHLFWEQTGQSSREWSKKESLMQTDCLGAAGAPQHVVRAQEGVSNIHLLVNIQLISSAAGQTLIWHNWPPNQKCGCSCPAASVNGIRTFC